ncbi:MAG: DUF2079 domain-containing protein [Candidatus Bathyarchaeota archaeon]|nr:DUF2079 domain-containing protein [Candidatus Bathyarchaeota archaeon]
MKKKYENTLYLCVIIYTSIFTYHTYLKHLSFSSFAWDLGIFNQLIYSSVFEGKLFYYTPELYMNPQGSYLAIHFSPILLTIFPIYALFPSVLTLLFLKSAILSAAAIPLYYISRKLTGSDLTSLIISVAYLLNPGLQGANWFDFQPQIFIPLLVFTTFLFLLERRWIAYTASLLLTLFIQEHVFTILIAMILGYLSREKLGEVITTLRHPKLNRHTIPFLSVPVCLLYYSFVKGYISRFPITPEFLPIYKATNVFTAIGYSGDTVSLPFYALVNLGKVLEGLSHDVFLKFLYILFLFAPLLFLPLMNRFMAANLLLLLPFLLSNYRAYYMIGSHYALYILPGLFIATAYTLKSRGPEESRSTAKYMLVASILVISMLSPVSPVSAIVNRQGAVLWYPAPAKITERTRWTLSIIDSIPGDAHILTQNHIFPHVSDRINAYVLPITTYSERQNRLLETYVTTLIEGVDYALLDLKSGDTWTLHAHRALSRSPEFGVTAFNDMMILFKRGEANMETVAHPVRKVFHAHEDLHIGSGDIVHEPGADSGLAIRSRKGSERGYCLYGPYTYLLEPAYDAVLHLKVENHGEGYLGTFEVTSDRGESVIAKRDLYGYEFHSEGWRSVGIRLALDRPREMVEFRVYTVGACDIILDRVELIRAVNPEGYHASSTTFNYRDLQAGEATVIQGGIMICNSTADEPSWYGPYHTLPRGRYRATFYLKAVPLTRDASGPLLTLDATQEHGRYGLAHIDVRPYDLDHEGLSEGWSRVELEFRVEWEEAVVELRGINPSQDYEVQLGHILLEPLPDNGSETP